MAILELLLAQKQLLSSLHRSISTFKPHKISDLEAISKKSLEVNYALLKMNAVRFSRYSSHRHMYRKTAKRLKIAEEYAELSKTSEYIEHQINNLKKLKEKKESARLAGLLAIISCLTVFQIFFYNPVIPIINDISGDLNLGKTFAYGINLVCACLIFIGFFLSIMYVVNTVRKH